MEQQQRDVAPAAADPKTPAGWTEQILAILHEHYGHVDYAAAHKLLTLIGKAQVQAINDCLTKIVADGRQP